MVRFRLFRKKKEKTRLLSDLSSSSFIPSSSFSSRSFLSFEEDVTNNSSSRSFTMTTGGDSTAIYNTTTESSSSPSDFATSTSSSGWEFTADASIDLSGSSASSTEFFGSAESTVSSASETSQTLSNYTSRNSSTYDTPQNLSTESTSSASEKSPEPQVLRETNQNNGGLGIQRMVDDMAERTTFAMEKTKSDLTAMHNESSAKLNMMRQKVFEEFSKIDIPKLILSPKVDGCNHDHACTTHHDQISDEISEDENAPMPRRRSVKKFTFNYVQRNGADDALEDISPVARIRNPIKAVRMEKKKTQNGKEIAEGRTSPVAKIRNPIKVIRNARKNQKSENEEGNERGVEEVVEEKPEKTVKPEEPKEVVGTIADQMQAMVSAFLQSTHQENVQDGDDNRNPLDPVDDIPHNPINESKKLNPDRATKKWNNSKSAKESKLPISKKRRVIKKFRKPIIETSNLHDGSKDGTVTGNVIKVPSGTSKPKSRRMRSITKRLRLRNELKSTEAEAEIMKAVKDEKEIASKGLLLDWGSAENLFHADWSQFDVFGSKPNPAPKPELEPEVEDPVPPKSPRTRIFRKQKKDIDDDIKSKEKEVELAKYEINYLKTLLDENDKHRKKLEKELEMANHKIDTMAETMEKNHGMLDTFCVSPRLDHTVEELNWDDREMLLAMSPASTPRKLKKNVLSRRLGLA